MVKQAFYHRVDEKKSTKKVDQMFVDQTSRSQNSVDYLFRKISHSVPLPLKIGLDSGNFLLQFSFPFPSHRKFLRVEQQSRVSIFSNSNFGLELLSRLGQRRRQICVFCDQFLGQSFEPRPKLPIRLLRQIELFQVELQPTIFLAKSAEKDNSMFLFFLGWTFSR